MNFKDNFFEFSENILKDNETFENEFLEWYNCGKPECNIEDVTGYESVGRYLLGEFKAIDTIRSEDRRWSVWIEKIYKFKDRYFMSGFDMGLTECQENEYWNTDVEEVFPKERIVKIIDWKTTK